MKARMQCGAIAGMLREIEGNEHDPSGPASFEHRCQAAVDAIRELLALEPIDVPLPFEPPAVSDPLSRPELEGAVLRLTTNRGFYFEWVKGTMIADTCQKEMTIEQIRESAGRFADFLAKMKESKT